MLCKPRKCCQRLLKVCKSGEISSHLVTLSTRNVYATIVTFANINQIARTGIFFISGPPTGNKFFSVIILLITFTPCYSWRRWKNISFLCFFFKNGPTPSSFIVCFRSFQTNIITYFTTNICEKMSIQNTVPGFEPTSFGTWVSSHNH